MDLRESPEHQELWRELRVPIPFVTVKTMGPTLQRYGTDEHGRLR